MAAELLDFSPLALVEDDFGSYERAVRLRAARGQSANLETRRHTDEL